MELHIASNRQHEASLQYESEKIHEELESVREQCSEYSNLITFLKTENGKLSARNVPYEELQLELEHCQDENERLLSQISMYSQLEMEAHQLREENESLAAQLTAMTERPAAEGRENEDQHCTEEKDDVLQEKSS